MIIIFIRSHLWANFFSMKILENIVITSFIGSGRGEVLQRICIGICVHYFKWGGGQQAFTFYTFPLFQKNTNTDHFDQSQTPSLSLSPALFFLPANSRVSFLLNQYGLQQPYIICLPYTSVCSPCHFKWKYINSPSTLILHTTMFAIISLFSRSTWLVNQALTQEHYD